MHLPDNLLNPGTSASLIGVAVFAVSFALNRIRKLFFVRQKKAVLTTPEGAEFVTSSVIKLTKYGQRKLPMMFSLLIFILFLQYFDVLEIAGHPGHFLGSALAVILLGPIEAIIVLSTVLIIQAVIIGDGGMVALGANIFNMAIIGCLSAYYIFNKLKKYKNKNITIFITAWLSVIVMSFFFALEQYISQQINMYQLFEAVVIYALFGLGEGLFTVFIYKILKFNK